MIILVELDYLYFNWQAFSIVIHFLVGHVKKDNCTIIFDRPIKMIDEELRSGSLAELIRSPSW